MKSAAFTTDLPLPVSVATTARQGGKAPFCRRLFGSRHCVQLHLGPRLLLFEKRPAVLHIEVIPG